MVFSWAGCHTRHQVSDKLAASPTSTLQEGSTRQVSASHDKSLSHTTSLRLARPPPNSDWCVGHDTRREPRAEHHLRNACGNDSPRHANTQAGGHARADPNKSLNAGQSGCAAIPSTSSPTLPHASSARGTQAPSTTRIGLGPSMAG
jgi:hypothetical protein